MADEYTKPLYDAVTDIKRERNPLAITYGIAVPASTSRNCVHLQSLHCACILVFLGHIALLLRLDKVRVYMLSQ